MLTADRRMQEGARDLAIALNLGRAEEALDRLRRGEQIGSQDQSYFEVVADLFLDALDGYKLTTAALQGETTTPSASALRAMRLLVPVVRQEGGGDPTEFLDQWAKAAVAVASGSTLRVEEYAPFVQVLRRLALLAGGEGLDAFETRPATVSFPFLGRLA